MFGKETTRARKESKMSDRTLWIVSSQIIN